MPVAIYFGSALPIIPSDRWSAQMFVKNKFNFHQLDKDLKGDMKNCIMNFEKYTFIFILMQKNPQNRNLVPIFMTIMSIVSCSLCLFIILVRFFEKFHILDIRVWL